MNIKDSIRKINYKNYKLSKGWNDMTINLKNYIENTHKFYIDDNFGNGKILCAIKK